MSEPRLLTADGAVPELLTTECPEPPGRRACAVCGYRRWLHESARRLGEDLCGGFIDSGGCLSRACAPCRVRQAIETLRWALPPGHYCLNLEPDR